MGIMPGKGCVDGNPIEEQYFSQFATSPTTDASSTTTGAVKETVKEGNEGVDDKRFSPPSDLQLRGYSEEPSELNEVDEQYFGGLRGQRGDHNWTVEVDEEDAKATRELLRESKEGLGFIDAQIFGSVEKEEE